MKFNNETLRAAVKEWLEDNKKAEAKYGHISNWDTTEVKSIADIYFKAKSLNIDVTNWSLSFEKTVFYLKKQTKKSLRPIIRTVKKGLNI